MKTQMEGKARVLPNNVDTDQIYPGRYLALVDPIAIGEHCLEGYDPSFSKDYVPGDILIAGTNFGCGSSREHAPIALLAIGVPLIIAESFARIFFRNAINLGLPLMVCPDISKSLTTGQALKVDLENGSVLVVETNEVINCERVGSHTMQILEAGGIKNLTRKKLGFDTVISPKGLE